MIKTMDQAFLHELSDTSSAEHQLTQTLKEMLGMATHPHGKKGLKEPIAETKQHLKNIDQIFTLLGEQPEDVTCKGAAGISREFKKAGKPAQMEERFAQQLAQVDQQRGQELVRNTPELVGHPGPEPKVGKKTR